MRVAIIGQQDFGKAVLEAFVARGDTVAGVFCAPEKPGQPADPLRRGAAERHLPVFQLGSLKTPDACAVLKELDVDLGVMAYVLQFAPQQFVSIPRYRGPSSINWPIIRGDSSTGVTVFRPTDGLDEGPVLVQKETPIGPLDTVGSIYFDRLFPMGVAAMLEAADLVVQGRAFEQRQDESQASYEGWCREPEARVNWHSHVDLIHNLIRGCDPAPGAWTSAQGRKLQLHAVRKHPVRRFKEVAGAVGAITRIAGESIFITAQGGQIEATRLRLEGGKKLPAAQVCAAAGLTVGAILGD
jgi:methionyl-tRNA formyltransferase